MTNQERVASPRPVFLASWVAVLAGTLAFALYVLTLSHNYSGDSFDIAMIVENGAWNWLIKPFHLLLGPLAWGFYQLLHTLGWTGRAMLPLQLLNALGGALCVALMVRVTRRLGASLSVAGAVSAGFAASFGIWALSTQAEFVTIPLAAALWVWDLSLGLTKDGGRPDYRRAGALGLVTALAVFTYATNALLVPVVIAGYLLDTNAIRRTKFKQASVYLLITGLCVIVPYLALGLLLPGDGSGLLGFLRPFGGSGVYGQVALRNIPNGVYGFLRTMGGYASALNSEHTLSYLGHTAWAGRAAFAGYYLLLLLAAATPVWLAWRRRRALWAHFRRPALMLAVWAIPSAAFGFYWVPGDISFWVPLLAAWWLLVAMLATLPNRDPGRDEAQARAMWWRARPAAVLYAAAAVLFAANAVVLLPDVSLAANAWYGEAQDIARQTRPGDLIFMTGDYRLNYYVNYFGQRETILLPDLPEENAIDGELLSWLNGKIDAARAAGGRVYLLDAPARSGPLAMDDGWLGPASPWNRQDLPAWTVDGRAAFELQSRTR